MASVFFWQWLFCILTYLFFTTEAEIKVRIGTAWLKANTYKWLILGPRHTRTYASCPVVSAHRNCLTVLLEMFEDWGLGVVWLWSTCNVQLVQPPDPYRPANFLPRANHTMDLRCAWALVISQQGQLFSFHLLYTDWLTNSLGIWMPGSCGMEGSSFQSPLETNGTFLAIQLLFMSFFNACPLKVSNLAILLNF